MAILDSKSKKKVNYVIRAVNKPHINPQKLRRGIIIAVIVLVNIGFLAGFTAFFVRYSSTLSDVGNTLTNVARTGSNIDLPTLGKIALGQVSDSEELFPQVNIAEADLNNEFSKLSEITTEFTLPKFLNDNWRIVGNADFNGDGQKELLLFNSGNNLTVTFSLVDNKITGVRTLPTISDKQWKLVLTDDFNNDKSPDLLWRYDDEKESKLLLWTMKARTISKQQWLALDVQNLKDWNIVGSGNFDENVVPDIALSYIGKDSRYKGANLVTFLEGTGTIKPKEDKSSEWLPFLESTDEVGNLTKTVVGVVDFDQDGFPDLVVNQNDKSKVRSQQGKVEIWLLKNTELSTIVNVEKFKDLTWVPYLTDINTDGATDFVWTNINSDNQKCQGLSLTWLMGRVFRLEAEVATEINECE